MNHPSFSPNDALQSALPYQEVQSQQEFGQLLQSHSIFHHYAFQSIDFVVQEPTVLQKTFKDCMFMGCKLNTTIKDHLDNQNNLLFPKISVPYDPFRNCLYDMDSLYSDYEIGHPETISRCFDHLVYKHYLNQGKRARDIKETLARSLHDHAMSDAMEELLDQYSEKDIVGMMGGHGLQRTDPMFRTVVYISKSLTEQNKLMVSGGGPGAMEATHLGAWMAGYPEQAVEDALAVLYQAPDFNHKLWLDTALQVMRKYPQTRFRSLGVPTWLYGHEPTTPFATHIAKYFDNAIREDGILTIAKGGIIYSPGSAGTLQEIFQDAVQNHYLSFGYASPMVFLGKEFWTSEIPVYPFLEQMMLKGRYKHLQLSLTDDIEEVTSIIHSFSNS